MEKLLEDQLEVLEEHWGREMEEAKRKTQKYKVELTGHMRYFAVEDEKGNEYTAVENYDTNPAWTEWTIYDKEGEEVEDEQLRDEIIEAVENH